MNPSTLPDNLISRISRVHVAQKSFTNDKGEKVDFKRLVLTVQVKGEDFDIEFKPEKADITLLRLADNLETARVV